MAYLPHTDADRRAMLEAIGASSLDELFSAIPQHLRDPVLDLPDPLGELELVRHLEDLARDNRPLTQQASFLGAGVYRRFIPALVRATISRPEFYTAYTPYQAEASQGTLQTIFEFQSMICALTGLDVANASLYDGATAAAEALLMAASHTGRSAALLIGDLHPEVLAVTRTFARARDLSLLRCPADLASVEAALDATVGSIVVAQPSFLGVVTDVSAFGRAAHAAGALAICYLDPTAAAVLTSAAAAGFDIAVGDGQPLGIPPSYGGPHVGFMAARTELLRRMPGRLVGMTRDDRDRRAFTLTLQTREQHIRRERATSNICTNHALMALAATVYMAQMGAGGMARVAEVSAARAHELANRLTAIPGLELAEPGAPYLWEFPLRCPQDADTFAAHLQRLGVLGGLPLGGYDRGRRDQILVCCTEMTSAADVDRYVEAAHMVASAEPERRISA